MTHNFKISHQPHMKDLVTPKALRSTPIHDWLVFPHSYSYELVENLVRKWGLGVSDSILDPFSGAGTTILSAKQLNLAARGYDISPFAVFVSNVKAQSYNIKSLLKCWEKQKSHIPLAAKSRLKNVYPELVMKALTVTSLSCFEQLESLIIDCTKSQQNRNFFKLALFAIMPSFSKAQATGGWLKWRNDQKPYGLIFSCYILQVEKMISDVTNDQHSGITNKAYEADVRCLPDKNEQFSAIITSPPYPNRHDYTRVFGIELMYGFLDWEGTRAIRYQSIHSHPEAKPARPSSQDYSPPSLLESSMSLLEENYHNKRIISMLKGYFVDIHCSLKEMSRVCKKGGNIALVLGNAQYNGVQFLVDEITAHIGEQIGLHCSEILTVRLRGNSAQQMKKFGRHPSRESIILFKKITSLTT